MGHNLDHCLHSFHLKIKTYRTILFILDAELVSGLPSIEKLKLEVNPSSPSLLIIDDLQSQFLDSQGEINKDYTLLIKFKLLGSL